MQHVRATILLSNTLAESTLPFHLCPDNDLMASCDQARVNIFFITQKKKLFLITICWSQQCNRAMIPWYGSEP